MNDTADSNPPAVPTVDKRCWLHVGMHKTGTTSVQASLGAIRNHPQWRMLKVGGRSNMGKALCAMFAKKPSKHSAFRKLGKSDEEIAEDGKVLREKLRETVQACPAPNIIISAEVLTSVIDQAGLAALRDLLAPFCKEIRVIGYVRPPVAFKASIFQEAVKHGKGKFNATEIKVGYRRRFRKFDEVFGRENVLLRKFAPASFPGGCIVADFCQRIGIEAPPPESIQRTNESLCREACGMLYAYRKFGPGYGVGEGVIRENNELISPFFGISGEKLQFSTKLMLRSLVAETKDIRWTERRIGESLHEKLSETSTGISTEEELLTVSRAFCLSYIEAFEKLHGMPVSKERIPEGDPVDPVEIAEFMEFCRSLIRVKLSAVPPPPPKKLFRARCRRLLRWLTGRTATPLPKRAPQATARDGHASATARN